MEFDIESNLFSINSLKTMEVIDINSGSRLGYIKDFVIDCEEYKVLSLIIPVQKVSLFGKTNTIEIPWEKIKKIGVDVILVDGQDIVDEE
ncbi:PRC-barrel domain protein [Clostridium tepidiprofundi DSM 19306]|uniref:PRC-barrel domain protein n=1 Tax=Clostridium tepidiprofundi DSM 19306 TaxID=1121338 RepID=A0A151B7T0_9CLOT|nr:YlmC/YmxH family sporulation protein [Clostridium tepidiprofundi]KYH35944.1 PRC-barrel domain protein [Clostridium tepidiprofundi DSM 19306]